MPKKQTLENIQLYLDIHEKTLGGVCLSSEYLGNKIPLLFKCKNKHVFKMRWNNVVVGQWCPFCFGKLKISFTVLQNYASSKKGLLLSNQKDYKCINTKLSWQCKIGHIWLASWASLKQGHWCPQCAANISADKRKVAIEIIQAHIKARNGTSAVYTIKNNKSYFTVFCGNRHSWKTCWHNLAAGKWCPVCAHCVKHEFKSLQNHATNKGGKLLSPPEDYKTGISKLLWECTCGNQWYTSWNVIYHDKCWCPECASFKMEKLCRNLLEQKLGYRLTKTKFRTPEGNKYEWDGYNKEHKIAFEYHGYQHYVYPNYWHKTEEEHIKAIQRDREKEQWAKDNNISLIIIPHTIKNVSDYINTLVM